MIYGDNEHVMRARIIMAAENQTESTSPCSVIDDYLQEYYGQSIFAFLVVILLSLLEKRRSFGRNVCFGRPGCLIPVNLLDGDEDLIAYAAAFGSTASNVFSLFIGQSTMYQKVNYNPWLIPFVVMELTVELGLQFYPLFTCIQYRWSLVMSSVGFLYSAILLSLNIIELKFCSGHSDAEYTILIQLPVLLCLGFLCFKFAFNFISTIVRIVKLRQGRQLPESKSVSYSEDYVINLFRFRPDPDPENQGCYKFSFFSSRFVHGDRSNNSRILRLRSTLVKIKRTLSSLKLCHQKKYLIRCSQRMLSIYVVSGVLLFQWLVIFKDLGDAIRAFLKELVQGSIQSNNTEVATVERLADVIEGSFYMSVVTSSLLAIISLVLLHFNHQRHVRMLLKGDNSFIPSACREMVPYTTLTRSMMFAGSQIGHLIWGYIMNCIVLTLTGILLSYGLILPVMKKAPDSFLNPVRAILPSIVITQGTIFILYFVSLWFLQKVDTSKSKLSFHRVLAITNRRAFQNLSYFLFFFYVPLGLVKSVKRNLFSFLCGLAFLGRLDRCIFVPGLENFDNGYLSYISFLKVEISHCSPLVVTFCNILYKEIHSKLISGNSTNDRSELLTTNEILDEDSDIISFCESEARKRWFKCYTLVNNPDICSTSKRYFGKKDKVKSRDCNHSLYGTIA